MNRDKTCLLCGATSHDVVIGLIRWSEPVGRDRFTAAPRCRDKAACRDRVEANGDRWEVQDPERSAKELIRG